MAAAATGPAEGLGPTPVPLRLRYSALEACLSVVLGPDEWAPHLPPPADPDPRTAMEAVVLEALRRPPCAVSFSGGRDSSAVLAVAAHVARREGLPAPVPVTNRFPEIVLTDEATWQESVVRHLGLEDWVRLEWTDELDGLGPIAERVHRRHGFAFPHNLHFHDPLLEQVAGGSLMTGAGGDETLGIWSRRHLRRLVYGRSLPPVRGLRALAREASPRALRVRHHQARNPMDEFGWIRPDVRRELERMRAESFHGPDLRWDHEFHRWWRSKYVQGMLGSVGALGADHDVLVRSPFVEGRFCAAWVAAHGAEDPPSRTSALRDLVGDLLPEALITRPTKAGFRPAFFATHSRAFVRRWSGGGIDVRLVDPAALRREWIGDGSADHFPQVTTSMLLRMAWLAERD